MGLPVKEKGTLLRVRVKETLDKRDQKEGEMQESPCNLIAFKERKNCQYSCKKRKCKGEKGR